MAQAQAGNVGTSNSNTRVTDSKSSMFGGVSVVTLAHIAIEILVVGGLTYWLNSKIKTHEEQNKLLLERLIKCEEQISKQNEIITHHENALRQFHALLQGLPPPNNHSPSQPHSQAQPHSQSQRSHGQKENPNNQHSQAKPQAREHKNNNVNNRENVSQSKGKKPQNSPPQDQEYDVQRHQKYQEKYQQQYQQQRQQHQRQQQPGRNTSPINSEGSSNLYSRRNVESTIEEYSNVEDIEENEESTDIDSMLQDEINELDGQGEEINCNEDECEVVPKKKQGAHR